MTAEIPEREPLPPAFEDLRPACSFLWLVLSHRGPTSPSELAIITRMHPQTVYRALGTLEDEDLITSQRGADGDAREITYRIDR